MSTAARVGLCAGCAGQMHNGVVQARYTTCTSAVIATRPSRGTVLGNSPRRVPLLLFFKNHYRANTVCSESGRHSPSSLFSCLRGLRPLPVPEVNSGTFTPGFGAPTPKRLRG